MTCKECIHEELCNYEDEQSGGVSPYFPNNKCRWFKNKADFVEVKKVANMFAEQFGDCPCNFNGIDEWLPYVCEHNNVCECSIEAGWEQFIRHYGERVNDNAE